MHEPIKATLPKGFKGTINGLEVTFSENLHFTIDNAKTVDQAAEFCHAQNLPEVDFSHFDGEKGVNVTYSKLDGRRIETKPEDRPSTEKKKK